MSVDYRVPAQTHIGHVHLKVSDLERSITFYRDVIGFDVVVRYGAQAAFLSAGGYHHHIGLNTWAGVGAPPPPPGAIGLKHFEVTLPGSAAREAVVSRLSAAGVVPEPVDGGLLIRDPARNAILLTTLG